MMNIWIVIKTNAATSLDELKLLPKYFSHITVIYTKPYTISCCLFRCFLITIIKWDLFFFLIQIVNDTSIILWNNHLSVFYVKKIVSFSIWHSVYEEAESEFHHSAWLLDFNIAYSFNTVSLADMVHKSNTDVLSHVLWFQPGTCMNCNTFYVKHFM